MEKIKTNWLKFELSCTNELNYKYSSLANFFHEGNSDSTIPDIKVLCRDGNNYYIEAKLCPAQCGQFVLIPNIEKQRFEYSKKNTNDINIYAKEIIKHMNEDFYNYKEAGTSGKQIVFKGCEKIFSKWIIEQYSKKKVRFFITNDYKILRLKDFEKAFNVSAVYRVKRSGSSSVGKTNIELVTSYLSKKFNNCKITIDEDKIFIESRRNLHDIRFIIGKYEYMISRRYNNYEIRKLSNTFNANVIFSITLKPNFIGLSDDEFIREL